MATTEVFKERFNDPNVPYAIALYIKDDNDNYVDFTDKAEVDGVNKLNALVGISIVGVKSDGTGLTASQPVKITLNNDDQFFNKPFPTTLLTEDGSTAAFANSSLGKHSVLYDRDVQLRIRVVHGNGAIEEDVLATFNGGVLTRTLGRQTVSLELRDKSLSLRAQDSATHVRDGTSWWTDKPIAFLVREALRLRFADTAGNLPSGFNIADKVEIESAGSIRGDTGDTRVLSSYGRQPERDDTGIYLNRTLICRDIVWGPKPSLLSAAVTPSGSAPTRSVIYMGLDDELWFFDPVTEESTLLDDSSLGDTFLIQRLFYSPHQFKIYGVAYGEETKGVSGTRTVTARFFRYDGATFAITKIITNFFPGDLCFRDGRQFGGAGTHKLGSPDDAGLDGAGENVPSMYGHTMDLMRAGSSVFFERLAESETETAAWDDGTTPIDTVDGYYYTTIHVGSNAGVPIHFRFCLGQKGFLVMNSRSESDIYLWYCVYNSGDETNDIERVNLKTLVIQTWLANIQEASNSQRVDPLCGAADPDSGAIVLGGVFWDDRFGINPESNGIMWLLGPGAPGPQKIFFDSTGELSINRYLTPIDMVMLSNNKVVVSCMRRDRLRRNDTFVIAEKDVTDSVSLDITVLNQSRNMISGLVKSDNDATLVYMYETGTGKLFKYTTGTGSLFSSDDGFPCVDNEYGLSCAALIVDSDTRAGSADTEIVYGVSSPVPYPTRTYSVIPNGKFELFKYDKFYTGRIELAKTEGISIWRFLEFLGQVSNYRPGFDRQGSFYFIRNLATSIATFEVTNTSEPKTLLDCQVMTGEREVYNVVRATPSSAFLRPPEFELRLVQRPFILDADSNEVQQKPFDSDVFIQQKDNRRRTIRLECITGGLVSDAAVKFRYRSTDERFFTTVGAVYTAASITLVLSSGIRSLRAGDTIIIKNESFKEEGTVRSDPTDAQIETGSVTLEIGFTNAYVAGDPIEVIKNLNQWSDDEPNLLEDPFFQEYTVGDDLVRYTESSSNIDVAEDITAGNYLYGRSTAKLTLAAAGTQESIAQTVVASDLIGDTFYTVSGFVKLDIGDGSNTRADEMFIQASGAGVIVSTITDSSTSTTWREVSVTFQTQTSPSGNLSIDIFIKKTGTSLASIGWVDGLVLQKGSLAKIDVILPSNAQYMPIPQTNTEFKFEIQNEETKLEVGDQLYIECSGMDTKEEEFSIRTAIDVTSRSRYGEIPYPDIKNRFLNRPLARDLVERVLEEFAFPKYLATAILPITPYLDFVSTDSLINRIKIISEELFHLSPKWAEDFKIKTIKHNIRSGQTVLGLRGVDKE